LPGESWNVIDELPKNAWLPILVMIGGILAIMIILLSGCAYSATLDQWADNIRIVEGVNSNYPYGVMIRGKNGELRHYCPFKARIICKRTIMHKFNQFVASDGKSYDLIGYINYLADRYCPKSADFNGNLRWKTNMVKLMVKGE
jgi:hypothetical protein